MMMYPHDSTMGPRLDIRHLRVLAAIAEEGGVTKASGRLYLTQSALSRRLKDAEEKLGTPLFLRVRKRMVLTPAGETLLSSARRVLDELRRAEEDVRRAGNGEGGVIRLSTQCYTCYHWLPAALGQLKLRFPRVEVRISVEDTRDPARGVLDGRLDLALVSLPPNDSRLRLEPLFEDEMVIVLPRKHRLARARFLEPGELDGETVLVYPPREESFLINELMAPAGARPGNVLEVPLTEAILELVQAGTGISLLAKWAVASYPAAKRLAMKRVTAAGFRREWHAAVLRQQPTPGHIQALIQLLQRQGMPFPRKARH